MAQNYTVEWKRSAFFRFVEHFSSDAMSQELKAKVLQMILIPCFAVSFEKGQKIVGGPPAPYQDNPDNVVSVFINNVSLLVILPRMCMYAIKHFIYFSLIVHYFFMHKANKRYFFLIIKL